MLIAQYGHVLENAYRMANGVDPDQTAPYFKEQSDRGLHCLPRQVFSHFLSSLWQNIVVVFTIPKLAYLR